ncbi:MAG: type II toxin-antitoxin system HicA family toxin [Pseudomonadota bacterium]
MPPFGPVKRRELVQYLKQCGFEGPYSGGKHQFMIDGETTIRVPNPHQGDIGKELLLRILHQARISKEVWEKL